MQPGAAFCGTDLSGGSQCLFSWSLLCIKGDQQADAHRCANISPQLFPGHGGGSCLQQCADTHWQHRLSHLAGGKPENLHRPVMDPEKSSSQSTTMVPCQSSGISSERANPGCLSTKQEWLSHRAKAGTAHALGWFSCLGPVGSP